MTPITLALIMLGQLPLPTQTQKQSAPKNKGAYEKEARRERILTLLGREPELGMTSFELHDELACCSIETVREDVTVLRQQHKVIGKKLDGRWVYFLWGAVE